ncbi:hypothetical protein TD95_002135 [Thielaviopsis punctulata]|uniref:Prokaryotic-type class I peptide chain release factors domain-containing protein n=1 Tax=Thielaviopsis punctulata TaxID=72032 RepID=A0A0F4Z9S4_9PEZI|nr:hypothetical protein TD95_002135 [Thielaviopsis punctulata]
MSNIAFSRFKSVLAQQVTSLRGNELRTFASLSSLLGKQMPPRPKPPPENEIEESFLKGSGPGGQKINKTNSAVQLKHIPTGIIVKSQATRSRTQNRNIARELLAQKLDDLYRGDQSRTSIVAAMKKKKQSSAAKKSRRKYRALGAEKNAAGIDVQKQDSETSLGQPPSEIPAARPVPVAPPPPPNVNDKPT